MRCGFFLVCSLLVFSLFNSISGKIKTLNTYTTTLSNYFWCIKVSSGSIILSVNFMNAVGSRIFSSTLPNLKEILTITCLVNHWWKTLYTRLWRVISNSKIQRKLLFYHFMAPLELVSQCFIQHNCISFNHIKYTYF